MYDIIVVGGGPAGSTAARRAAELGFNVICLEKSEMPRVKPCGGGISPSAVSSLAEFQDIFDCFTAGVMFYGPRGEFLTRSDLPSGAFVIRSEFDHKLLLAARAAGAIVVEGERVIDIKITDDSVKVFSNNQEYEGQILCGADGVNSIVASRTGLRTKWAPKDVAQVYVNESKIDQNKLDEFYTPSRKPIFHLAFKDSEGYGWIFPKKITVNVGFGSILKSSHNTKAQFQNYVAKCQEEGLLPEIDPKNTTAALIPFCGPLRRVYKNRVLLLGDAGGFVNPANGEGIPYAIKSGMIAAEISSEILKKHDFRGRAFKEYQKRCMKEFGNDLHWYGLAYKFGLKRISHCLKYSQQDPDFGRLFLGVLVSIGIEKKWELIRRYLGFRVKEIFKK
jgi:geranylgeranyl reductase family protein